eukprot:353017-Chlamydomonas_euryale.AAC.7
MLGSRVSVEEAQVACCLVVEEAQVENRPWELAAGQRVAPDYGAIVFEEALCLGGLALGGNLFGKALCLGGPSVWEGLVFRKALWMGENLFGKTLCFGRPCVWEGLVFGEALCFEWPCVWEALRRRCQGDSGRGVCV